MKGKRFQFRLSTLLFVVTAAAVNMALCVSPAFKQRSLPYEVDPRIPYEIVAIYATVIGWFAFDRLRGPRKSPP